MSAPGDPFREDVLRVHTLERLRAQLAGLVERQLRAQAEAEALEQRYIERFGALMWRSLQAQMKLEATRSRRALMAQRCAPGRVPDLVEAAAIEHEVAQLARRPQRRCAALRAALDTPPQRVAVPPADAELSAALRRVLRCLHPDVRGEAGEAYERYWPQVVADFRAGRTAALRALAEDLEAGMSPLSACGGPAFEHEELRLRRAVETCRQRLRDMEARRPLQLRACLTDPAWIAREHAALTRRVLREEQQAVAESVQQPAGADAAPLCGAADDARVNRPRQRRSLRGAGSPAAGAAVPSRKAGRAAGRAVLREPAR